MINNALNLNQNNFTSLKVDENFALHHLYNLW